MNSLGIIGFGNMGSAIAERIKSKYKVFVFDKDQNKIKNLSGLDVADNNIDLVKRSDAIILAIKPQDLDITLEEIKNHIKNQLVISIAAGITTNYIENKLGNVRVIRVMPNMPAKIGEGMTCICKGKFSNDKDLFFVKQLFENLGRTLIVSDEEMMDVATAISGSGPGYLFDLIENNKLDKYNKDDIEKFQNELAQEAKSHGFKINEAMTLAEATTSGGIKLIEVSNLPISELKKQITSKGGTTEAALKVLYKKNPYSLHDAVEAALKRAKELSKK